MWPKQQTATSRTTAQRGGTGKRQDRGRNH